MTTEYPLLETIHSPADLRKLPESQLKQLADETRAYLLDTISQVGGHFGAGLGTVELTVALHYVFNTPDDLLVWDVGHQTYPHKILTGRRDQLPGIRKKGGIAGFPKRSESEYDTFGVGHSSTSIGAALGMAVAAEKAGEKKKAVAIIGDGAMTAGQAFEALNHAGAMESKPDLLVILNDNDMSISENVGGLNHYLTRVLSGKMYTNLREGGKKVLQHLPPMWELARRAEEHMKGMIVPGTLFEELGVHYFGPVDGHDVPALIKTLKNLHDLEGPRLLHVVTRKGKGYAPAEAEPIKYHAVSAPFDPEVGMVKKTPTEAPKPTYTQVFGQWLCDMAEKDERLIGITPAMREGSGMVEFAKRFPDRYVDVAIAEQHAVTYAAGLACEGAKPVVAIYSTFLQRAYDQLIHDVAIQNLPVLFAIDRGGLVGNDGPTHAGAYDISYLRCIPNMVVMAPADENECRQMLYTGYGLDQPVAVRYPRGKGDETPVSDSMGALQVGKAEIRRQGKNLAILGLGAVVPFAQQAAEELDATVVNLRFAKPLDEATVLEVAQTHDTLLTVEDGSIPGGVGEAIASLLMQNGISKKLKILGIPDRYIDHQSREEMLEECGLDAAGILAAARNL